MEIEAFARAISEIGQQFGGSVTSWGRTKQHTLAVGGINGDPHMYWLGVDLIYDAQPEYSLVEAAARALGLHCIRETAKPHDHFQPVTWQNKPV